MCFRYGGSLPNVNQMSAGGSPDVQNSVQGDIHRFPNPLSNETVLLNYIFHWRHYSVLTPGCLRWYHTFIPDRECHIQEEYHVWDSVLDDVILCQIIKMCRSQFASFSSSKCVIGNINFRFLETSNFKCFAWNYPLNLWQLLRADLACWFEMFLAIFFGHHSARCVTDQKQRQFRCHCIIT